MAANEKQQGSRTKYLGNAMALLLRKHDADTARKIEATYVPKVDTSGEEYQSLREGACIGEVVDRSIERLLSANDRGRFLNVYETVRGKNTELGNRMLDAALKNGENHPGPIPRFF